MSRKHGLQRALCAAAIAVAFAGCGEEPADRGAESAFATPRPRETSLAAVEDLRAIVRARSCSRMARRWHTANGVLNPSTCAYLFRRLGAITDIRPRPRGTGLAVSFASPTGTPRRSAVFALDTDGRWRLLLVVDIDRGPIPALASIDRDVRALIRAIARLDCRAIIRLAHQDVGIAAAASRGQACNQVTSSDFAAALGVYPGRKPRVLGRGRNFTFYAMDLAEVGYYTILMARAPLGKAPGRPVKHRFVTAVQSR